MNQRKKVGYTKKRVNNEKLLMKIEPKLTLILLTREKQLEFLGNKIRKGGF